jgi:hypothetical protein
MYPSAFYELARIRAHELRRDADPRPRPPRRSRGRLRRKLGSRLVSLGTRMMREAA